MKNQNRVILFEKKSDIDSAPDQILQVSGYSIALVIDFWAEGKHNLQGFETLKVMLPLTAKKKLEG